MSNMFFLILGFITPSLISCESRPDILPRGHILVSCMSADALARESLNLKKCRYHLEIEPDSRAGPRWWRQNRTPWRHLKTNHNHDVIQKFWFSTRRLFSEFCSLWIARQISTESSESFVRLEPKLGSVWSEIWIGNIYSSVFFFFEPNAFFFRTFLTFSLGAFSSAPIDQSRRSLQPAGRQSSPFHLFSRSIFDFESVGRFGFHCGWPRIEVMYWNLGRALV